jgi:ABC-type branched-subunit amino acid transport system substrate-binding protein
MVVACFLILALVAVPCLGCGNGERREVTITIGELTDLTGPASTSTIYLHYALQDTIRYYNEEGLIPGVKLRLTSYDTNYNTARTLLGYYWLKERGAKVLMIPIANDSETAKAFAERDKIPIAAFDTTTYLIEPPGWVFCFSPKAAEQQRFLLKWISDHWDYSKGIPKVGFMQWNLVAGVGQQKAFKEYAQAHPDKFDFVYCALPPVGTQSYGAQVGALKDCDYIEVMTLSIGPFIRDYRARGYDRATFISDSSASAFLGLIRDMLGDWEGLDGFLSLYTALPWGEPNPTVELGEKLLYDYHSAGEAGKIVHSGQNYVGVVPLFLAMLQIIEKAIGEVGAQNFDGQAFYAAALDFEVQFEGYPKYQFTETERCCAHEAAVYKWSAEAEGPVRLSDWLPLAVE